jgi:type VI secretion system secreted protein Hcp
MPIYMKYDGIDGDVTAEGHDKWIELQSLQFGTGRGIQTATGRGADREASAPSISEMVATKLMDLASSKLFLESLVGEGKKVQIDLCRTGEKLEVYMTYELEDTLISSYSVSSGGERPMESLSLNFTKITQKYIPYDSKHKPQSPLPAGYDLSLGKKV